MKCCLKLWGILLGWSLCPWNEVLPRKESWYCLHELSFSEQGLLPREQVEAGRYFFLQICIYFLCTLPWRGLGKLNLLSLIQLLPGYMWLYIYFCIRIQICSCKRPVLVYILCPAHRLQSLTTQHMTTMFNRSWACSTLGNAIEWQLIWVVSNCRTGLLGWITRLTFELKLCAPHDLHPIRCAVNESHVRCLYWAANRLPRNKRRSMQLLWEVCAYTTADGAAWSW